MTHCVQSSLYSRNRKSRREKQLLKLANMRASKVRKRLERGAAGILERDVKLNRFYPLELGVRDNRTGETVWIDLKSVRDSAKRLTVLLKYYHPGVISRP